MRLALAAVADDGHRLAVERGRIDIGVVDELRHDRVAPFSLVPWVASRSAVGGAAMATAPARTRLRRPWPRSAFEGVIDGVGWCGQAGPPDVGAGGERLPACRGKDVFERALRGGSPRRIELDQHQLQLDVRRAGQVGDLEDLDDPLQLRQHLAQVPVVAADGDGHARAAGLVGGADGQRLDVEAAGAEQPRDAVQRPGTVDDQRAHHVPAVDRIGLAGRHGPARRRHGAHSGAPSTMSDSPLPGSIMG